MIIDYQRYPLPRTRHHTAPTSYIPHKELHLVPHHYPPLQTTVQWSDYFANGNSPSILDIGCGFGRFSLEYAYHNPTVNVLGIETRSQATEWTNNLIKGEGYTNVHSLWYSVVNGIDFIQPNSIEKIFYFFPDPWYKKRHVKRRAFTAEFLNNINRVLAPNGALYLMTDVPEVDDYQCEVLQEHGIFTQTLITNPSDWFPYKTDQELLCIRKSIPYTRRICTRA